MENGMTEGSLDLLNAFIGKDVNLKKVLIKDSLVLKQSKIQGRLITENTKYEHIIR